MLEPVIQEATHLQKLDNLSKRLEKHTYELDTLDKNNGLLIRQQDSEFGTFELSPEKQMANVVFNALGHTLKSTSEICLTKTENKESYLKAAEVFIIMLASLQKIGNESIHFVENFEAEKNTKEKYKDEELFIFESKNIEIDGIKIEKLKILVRPTDTIIDERGTVKQLSQARTRVSLFSKDLPGGEASIRIDPPDKRMCNDIVFDLAIGAGKGKTMVDSLDLDQTAGHHFQSRVNVSEFGQLDISNVHRAIVRRLMELS